MHFKKTARIFPTRSSDIRGFKGNVVEFLAEDRLEKGCLPRLPWTSQDNRGELGYGLF
jgi:hypothetical protein